MEQGIQYFMYSIYRFNRARDSLAYIIEYYRIKEMHIPYYLCNAVRHCLVRNNCKPLFYHVDDDFMPVKNFDKDSFILYPNYFGICNKNVKILESQYPNLIVDNAHAFFSAPSGLSCFNSAYKFELGNFSYLYIKQPCKNSGVVPVLNSNARNERIQIFRKLHTQYSQINLLKIDKESIPFCYPCLFDTKANADKFVKNLNLQNITVYRYWELLPKTFNEYKFYSRLVPIPIKTNTSQIL